MINSTQDMTCKITKQTRLAACNSQNPPAGVGAVTVQLI